jgi:diguanylate cyclase (GGDEF)-like protein/PAS domain S-box-containing protein
MTNSTARRLWLGFGSLLVVFAAVGFYTVSAIEASRESLRESLSASEETARESSAAVSDMKGGVDEIGVGTLNYAANREGAREQVERGRSRFEEASVRYDALAAQDSAERREQIDARYREYVDKSEAVMEDHDEQEAASEQVEEGFDEVRSVLGEIRSNINSRGPGGPQKAREAALMGDAVSRVDEAFRDYLKNPRTEARERGARSASDFRETLSRFRELDLGREQEDRVDTLSARFGETVAGVEKAQDLAGPAQERRQEFSDLRVGLDDLIEAEAQALRSGPLERAQGTAEAVFERTRVLVLVALAAALVAFSVYAYFVVNARRKEAREREALLEREAREQERRERDSAARAQLAAIVESSEDAIIARRLDGVITGWNLGAQRLYGYTAEEVVGGYGFDLVPPERLNEMLGILEKLDRWESSRTHETVHVDKWGRLIDVAQIISPIRDAGGNAIGYSTIVRDITERKESERSLRQQKDLYEALLRAQSEVGEGFIIVEDERVVYTNEAFCEISGYGPEELMALPSLLDIVAEEERRPFGRRLGLLPGTGEASQETVILHKDGHRVVVETGIKGLQDPGGSPRLIAIVRDVTERRRAEERLAHMARYDHLTGLGNRALFGEHLEAALARSYRNARSVALVFLDLDGFKAINDTLGHVSGDLLLKTVAGRLRDCVRETDTIARMGGDEFGIILEGISEGPAAALVAEKLLAALSEPIDLDGQRVFVTCSIGIAVSPPSADADLVRDADAAMYRAKQQGRNNYQFYTPEMDAQASRRIALEGKMRTALEREEFELRYQPQIDLKTGRIAGAEVLLRWRRPDAALIPPAEFIDVLEESGLIVPVGDWVLRTACAQGKAWEEAGMPPLRIAVNLSTRQFREKALVTSLARALDETGMNPGNLELELTESLLMEDTQTSSAMLDELRMLMGLKLSVDDFGTGYSSLSYLKRFPLDTLKIDRSFVRDIATDGDDAAIVTSIISLAHNLGLRVIAEGVETEEQLNYLMERGCDEVQGYYFSRPIPAERFYDLLTREEPFMSAAVGD